MIRTNLCICFEIGCPRVLFYNISVCLIYNCFWGFPVTWGEDSLHLDLNNVQKTNTSGIPHKQQSWGDYKKSELTLRKYISLVAKTYCLNILVKGVVWCSYNQFCKNKINKTKNYYQIQLSLPYWYVLVNICNYSSAVHTYINPPP